MGTSTRILAGGAALLAAAGLLAWQQGWWAGAGGAGREMGAPVTPAGGAEAIAPAAPASEAPNAARAASAPASAATGLQARATAAPHPIGSEGYGPHVQAAQESGDAARAWQALNWLQTCKTNAIVVAEAEKQLRGRPNLPPEVISQLIESSQAEARRCQTITPELAALEPQLALSAMRGGIAGAAALYARATLGREQDEAWRAEVLPALQRDAMQGHQATLAALLTGGSRLGIADVERRAYQLAFAKLYPEDGMFHAAAQMPQLAELMNVRVSAADEQRAKALAEQIIAAGRRAAQPPRP